MALGEQLKYLRRRANITQEKLADIIEVHTNTIRKWEKNITAPKFTELTKIADALQVPVSALYGNDVPPAAPVIQPTLGLAYWGEVAENMQKLANSGNIDEINAIYSLLNIGFNALAKTKENNSGINITQSNIGRDAKINIERSN